MALVKHELKRWLTAPMLWAVTVISAVMVAFSTYGNFTIYSADDMFSQKYGAIKEFSNLVLGLSLVAVLFVFIFAAYVVTTDFANGFSHYVKASQKTVIAWVVVKMLAAIFAGLIILSATYWASVIVAHLFLKKNGYVFSPYVGVGEYYWKISLAIVFYAILGTAIGFLVRRTAIAVVVIFAFTTGLENYVSKFSEKVFLWFPTGAFSSVTQDPSMENLMTVSQGLGIFVLWGAAAFLLAFVAAKRPLDVGGRFLKKNAY